MSLPTADCRDGSTSTSYIVRKVPGRGYQRRTLISDSQTGQPICQRIGGIPFATPLTQSDRFKRAKPLPSAFQYGSTDAPTDCTGLARACPQTKKVPGQSEDCLQMNIYIPHGQAPAEGWPVFFYIFGGFLQVGSPNNEDPVNLYRQSSFRAIFVSFTYRLNAFGFLASRELQEENDTVGNVGFWDQRLALEFVASEIQRYGGNPNNVTIGGLSAGAYSVFHQLAYSLSLPADKAYINRVVMWSNGCGLQPKGIEEAQISFKQLTNAFDIPDNLPGQEKLARLRAVPTQDFVAAVKKVPGNSFRAVTDGQFVRFSLFEELFSDSFAKKMKSRGIKLIIGDCCDEYTAYRSISPPTSYTTLLQRLGVEFRHELAQKAVTLYCPGRQLPEGYNTWQDIFGRIYADLQVHMTQRGFLSSLSQTLPADYVFRYRIETRADILEKIMPRSLGVTHGSDLCWWFMAHNFGMKGNLKDEEVGLARELVEPLAAFVRNGTPAWGTSNIRQVRLLNADGVSIVSDPWWDTSITTWRRLQGLDRQRL